MRDDIFKEFFQKSVSSKSDKEIQDQMNEGRKYTKISDVCPTIVVPDVGISSEELIRQLTSVSQIIQQESKNKIYNGLECLYSSSQSLQELSDSATDPDDFSSDIPSLKKRIKYCKNPLERKSLEKQLNVAYKVMKKRR